MVSVVPFILMAVLTRGGCTHSELKYQNLAQIDMQFPLSYGEREWNIIQMFLVLLVKRWMDQLG